MFESKKAYILPIEKRKLLTKNLSYLEFAKDIYSMVYPLKPVKHFIYRPMLGRWYPHIDLDLFR